MTLTPGGKKPALFKLVAKIPNCYPKSTVQVLGATYQIDATDGLPACLQNAQPATISIRGNKRTKPYDGSTCSGAAAVSCYPGYYAVNASAPCEPCGINKGACVKACIGERCLSHMYVPAGLILNYSVCLKYTTITTTVCGGGTQPAPELVDCPLGTGTITGEFSAYDPASCVVLPCNPCGSTTPDLYLTSKLSVYKQPAWAPGLPLDADTAELQCTLDQTDTFICQLTSSCTLNDIAIDNQVRGSEGAPSLSEGQSESSPKNVLTTTYIHTHTTGQLHPSRPPQGLGHRHRLGHQGRPREYRARRALPLHCAPGRAAAALGRPRCVHVCVSGSVRLVGRG